MCYSIGRLCFLDDESAADNCKWKVTERGGERSAESNRIGRYPVVEEGGEGGGNGSVRGGNRESQRRESGAANCRNGLRSFIFAGHHLDVDCP